MHSLKMQIKQIEIFRYLYIKGNLYTILAKKYERILVEYLVPTIKSKFRCILKSNFLRRYCEMGLVYNFFIYELFNTKKLQYI